MSELPIAIFGAKGKYEIITSFVQENSIYDAYKKVLNIDGKNVQIDILDTGGQDDFAPLRTSYLRRGKGFIFFYNIDDIDSFKEIEAFYFDLTRSKGTNDVPFVICGNEVNPDAKRTVSKEEGKAIANKYNAGFFETSVSKKINIEEPFIDITRRVLEKEKKSAHPPEKKDEKKKEKKKKFSLFKKKKE